MSWIRCSPRLRWFAVLAVLGLLAAAHLSAVLHRRGNTSDGDFDWHRRFGERFLQRTPPLYEGNLCFNYMPVSALYYAPLALFPEKTAFVLRYTTALACLALTLYLLGRMVLPAHVGRRHVVVIGLTVVLALRYIIRDLDDGGPHLIYLAMLVGGGYCAWRGRDLAGGVLFGLAIAVKMSPALLLPYLAWKRRWRLLGVTSAAMLAWVALPALWLGAGPWWHYQQQWSQAALGSCTGDLPKALRAHVEKNDLRLQNQSLRLALMHLLVTYPEGHDLHPAIDYWSVLDLDPALARLLMNIGLLALLAVFWWPTRQPSASRQDPTGALELAGLLLLMLLLSPVTWTQHLDWMVPALFCLLAADWPRRRAWLARGVLGVFFLMTAIQSRSLLGHRLDQLLTICHVHTMGLLLLLGLVLWLRVSQRTTAATPTSTIELPATSRQTLAA